MCVCVCVCVSVCVFSLMSERDGNEIEGVRGGETVCRHVRVGVLLDVWTCELD